MENEIYRVKQVKTLYSNGIFIPQIKKYGIWLNVGLMRLHLFNRSLCLLNSEKEAKSRIKLFISKNEKGLTKKTVNYINN